MSFVLGPGRNHYDSTPERPCMVQFGPMFYIVAAAILLFVFFLYMFVRRTFQGFKEGLDESKRK